MSAIYALVLLILTYLLQTYQLTYREEADIFLFDSHFFFSELLRPGGVSYLFASFCSQFFVYTLAGPLIVALIYYVVISSLMSVGNGKAPTPMPITALTIMPCLCMMLCFENMSFRTFGIVAVMFSVLAIPVYQKIASVCHAAVRIIIGCIMCALLYWMAGSIALISAVSFIVIDLFQRPRLYPVSMVYPLVVAAAGYICYRTGIVYSLSQAFTPDMYYEMGSTHYMMLYAACSVPLYLLLAFASVKTKMAQSVILCAILTLAIVGSETVIFANIYRTVHSSTNYETMQQRYYARHRLWDEILGMPYHGEPTPYTSYRFLALAQKGQLASSLQQYRPFISYLIENKPKVKRLDQQIYSDIYYACDYMAAARKAAFDTDIVTPGAFNPYETLKLAEINIAYGDYAVADKLLTQLDKTLFYSTRAKELRGLLYENGAVETHQILGPQRRAIPPGNNYMSPKGIQRDLRYIIDTNKGQVVAQEFYKAFRILTNQDEDN